MRIRFAFTVGCIICVALSLTKLPPGRASAAPVPATAPAEQHSGAGAASPETAAGLVARIRSFSPDAADLKTFYLEGRVRLGSEQIVYRYAWERDKHAAFYVLDAADGTMLFASVDGQLLSYDPVGAFIVSDHNPGVALIMKCTPEQVKISWNFLPAVAVPNGSFDIDLPSFFAQVTDIRATQLGPEAYELTGVVRSSAVNAVVNLKDKTICERLKWTRNKEFVFSIDRLTVNEALKNESVFIPSGATLARWTTVKALSDLSPAERERLCTFGAAALAVRRGFRVPSERKSMEESFGPVEWNGAVTKDREMSTTLRREFESVSLPVVAAATTAPSVGPDQSLTLIEYAAAGVPAPERPWTVEDYRKATAALRKLDASKLPRKDSPNSGALFRRMASPENLEPLIHPSRMRPLDERMLDSLFADVAGKLLIVYPEYDERFSSERAALIANELRAIRWTIPLLNECRDAFPKDNPDYDHVMRSIGRFRGICGEFTYGFTCFLSDSKHLDAPGRLALASAMTDLLPAYIRDLSSDDQRRILASLAKAWDFDRSERMRDELKKLDVAFRTLAPTRPAAGPGDASKVN